MMSKQMKTLFFLSMTFSIIGALIVANVSPALARDSKFTRKGSGPLYWSTYEYQYSNNAPMNEAEWKKNIDWIAEEYQPYGYDMVVTDGWIEPSQRTNENGYIVSHNDQWKYDWSYWANYAKEKGLKLGVYYNPLWVTRSAANDPTKKIVGTNYLVKDIANSKDVFNSDLYWVDVTKPGAKEYVQGYVQYFKNIGVPYLRIDFLSWYENGIDKGRKIGINHGEENYKTTLKWIEEAAGDDMEISLVMPHLFNHGKNELLYGDMIRINEDLALGGWQNLSGQRQNWVNGWSQWANPFTGFTGFSDIAGRGSSIILDGDFIRMNTFENDNERETIINLFTMAGSPIAITDQYSTIGAYGKFYKNQNLLDLQKSGFVGKPYYYNNTPFSLDASARDTERWLGQRSDGSWVVGLFNRSDESTTRAIDYVKDLGLSGSAKTKELWTNVNLGSISNYAPTLSPHASKVISIIPEGNRPRYQSEVATWLGGTTFNNDVKNYQGFGYVDHLDENGAKVVFAVEAPEAGDYELTIRYGNTINKDNSLHISVQDEQGNSVQSAKQVAFNRLNTSTTWANQLTNVSLQKGLNYITIEHQATDQGSIGLDYIELNLDKNVPSSSAVVINSGFETGDISGWYETHPRNQKLSLGVDTNNPNNGQYKAYLWSLNAFQQSIHQNVSGLNPGTYSIRAIVKNRNYGNLPEIVRMELTQYGGQAVYVNITPSQKYISIRATIKVTSGHVDIGFKVNSSGLSSLQVDQVYITKIN